MRDLVVGFVIISLGNKMELFEVTSDDNVFTDVIEKIQDALFMIHLFWIGDIMVSVNYEL